jgi:hypothetical protein
LVKITRLAWVVIMLWWNLAVLDLITRLLHDLQIILAMTELGKNILVVKPPLYRCTEPLCFPYNRWPDLPVVMTLESISMMLKMLALYVLEVCIFVDFPTKCVYPVFLSRPVSNFIL